MLEEYLDWLQTKKIFLTKTQIEKLNSYGKLVLKWNKKINLTAAKDLKEIVTRHILDSLMPLTIGFEKETEAIDLGSGGGFPAIPLAIALENTSFILIEKVAKKCAFLNKIKREINLKNIEVENCLFEEIDFPLPKTMITRAVKVDKKLITKIKKRGINLLYTFETSKPEDYLNINEYSLPGEKKIRYIVKREVK